MFSANPVPFGDLDVKEFYKEGGGRGRVTLGGMDTLAEGGTLSELLSSFWKSVSIEGTTVKIFFESLMKRGSTLKGKSFLPFGANSFLIEETKTGVSFIK